MNRDSLLILDRGRVAAEMEHLRYRNVPANKVDRLPTQFSNVNEVTRRATRMPDAVAYHYRHYPKLTATTALVWVAVMIGCGWGLYEILFG